MSDILTKSTVELDGLGLRPGDTAYLASLTYGDEDDPSVEYRTVGTFKTLAGAKWAARHALKAVEADLPPGRVNGWWSASVETGQIVSTSFDDPGYGHVIRWEFEADDRLISEWFITSAGVWQS